MEEGEKIAPVIELFRVALKAMSCLLTEAEYDKLSLPHRERNQHDQEVRRHPELSRKLVLGWGGKDRGRNKLVGQVERNAQHLTYGKPLPSVTTKIKKKKKKDQGFEEHKGLNHNG